MSIVGTRPPLISETNLYEPRHKARLAIKPGITGMWQVSGRSDITDSGFLSLYGNTCRCENRRVCCWCGNPCFWQIIFHSLFLMRTGRDCVLYISTHLSLI